MPIRKRLVALLLTTSLLLSATPAVAAGSPPLSLYVNGRELYLPQDLILQNDRVLVPMRAYLESLGAEVGWQPPDLVTASVKGRSVQLQIGSTTALVNDTPVTLDVPAQIIGDRTYVPLRFLSEGLGAQVDYDGVSVSVRTAQPNRLQVVDGPLNVRQAPTTASPILTTVPLGTTFDILTEKPPSAWTEVLLPGGVRGWVANQYTRKVTDQPVVEPFLPLLEPRGYLQAGGQCLGAIPIIADLTVVPLSETVAQLGGSVSKAGSDILVELGGRRLQLRPGSAAASLDGQPIVLTSAPMLVGGRPFIAARDLADSFGLPLTWNDPTRTVTLGAWSGGTPCNPAASANAYFMMDVATGVVLSEYNAGTPYAIASTTKIMTALLAVERGNPDSVVTVSWNAANQPGTSVYLRTGEQRTLRELLYGLMTVSGNDAATAIAEHLAGSEPAFAQLMNQRAAELGAVNTYFVTASGLDDWVNPYSTARDLATIARYALQNPHFRVYMSQSQVRIPGPAGARLLTNSNRFVLNYPGATGVKNGWTEKANHTLVASAFRDGREVLLVLLGAPTKDSLYQQAYNLMDHGFTLAGQSWLLN